MMSYTSKICKFKLISRFRGFIAKKLLAQLNFNRTPSPCPCFLKFAFTRLPLINKSFLISIPIQKYEKKYDCEMMNFSEDKFDVIIIERIKLNFYIIADIIFYL